MVSVETTYWARAPARWLAYRRQASRLPRGEVSLKGAWEDAGLVAERHRLASRAVNDDDATLRRLNVIRIVAILDFLLLVPLVVAALSHSEGVVSISAPSTAQAF